MTHLAIELPFPPFPNLWTPQHLTEHEGFKIWLPKTTGYVACTALRPNARSELLHTLEVGPTWTDGSSPVGKSGVCSCFFALASQDAPHALNLGFLGDASPQFRSAARGPARFRSYQEALRWVLLFGNRVRNAKGAGSRLPLSISGSNRLGSSIVVADEIHRLTETWMWRKRQSAPGRES